MISYGLLDQADEDALHKSRLLNVEEKPFKRITKRLLAPNSPITHPLLKTPVPSELDGSRADEVAAEYEAERRRHEEERRQFREDVLLDFAAFESSIIRMQLLLTSNARERERYAAEKLRIQATAQEVRDNTTELRVQLEEAQKTLALRKTYDELAEKITSNRLLRPREDQHANLDKLNAEIADLERESRDYAQTWAERRQQFGRIIEEGMQLRRLIRDEKEEVERREGMEEREDVDEGETGSLRGRSSGVATPHHDVGGVTPLHPSTNDDSTHTHGLAVDRHVDPRGKSPLRTSNIAAEAAISRAEESEDTNMAEDGEVSVEFDDIVMSTDTRAGEIRGGSREQSEDGRITANGDQMDTS
ncbi:hypothetical protein MMC30_006462 [Trapelia coarctata]|nr:hypothetical protein [Trapelia coarctata]